MNQPLNELGQPVGELLPGWKQPPWPAREVTEGRYCRLEPINVSRHAEKLFTADSADESGASWTYLPYGPFTSLANYTAWMKSFCFRDDPLFYAIIDLADGAPAGVTAYLNIVPSGGSIELGHLHYSPRLQKKPAATEAMYLMMERAFELGYRRYEWKAHAQNAASRAAAQRLGLSFEGVFRQAAVVKGRNRDTSWYAAIDSEWPALRTAFQTWLDPANFDAAGKQRVRLSALTRGILKNVG